jgi:hypothetical protein
LRKKPPVSGVKGVTIKGIGADFVAATAYFEVGDSDFCQPGGHILGGIFGEGGIEIDLHGLIGQVCFLELDGFASQEQGSGKGGGFTAESECAFVYISVNVTPVPVILTPCRVSSLQSVGKGLV